MNSVRSLYDKLSPDTRIRIRSLIPDYALRWYAHKNTDVYLISYPKCGRTWLRLMIGRAIANHFSLPETEDFLLLNWKSKIQPDIPKITLIHDDRPMLKSPDELEVSKVRYKDKDIIFLVRDPRDVIVSSYFEMKKRGYMFGDNPYETRRPVFEGDLSGFIKRRNGGFDTILKYYNIWADNRYIPKNFLLVRYEDIKVSPHQELRKIMDFLGLKAIQDAAINEAVNFASFENMQRMEAEGNFSTGILRPGDQADKDSFKTRKGKVRGFVDYLNQDQIEFLNRKMGDQLSEYFEYNQ